MKPRLSILLIFFLLAFSTAQASHIVGGEFTYKYLGDTVAFGTLCHKYQVSLSIYEDCENGQPEAINQDNPAYLSLYDAGNSSSGALDLDTSVYYVSSVTVPANFSNACIKNVPPVCLLKKTFVKTYYLPPNAGGYLVAYERCCRNNAVGNIVDPGDNGSTYFCSIPPYPYTNNSAVFKNYPPQIICLNNPLYYDHSAIDIDGDSLSYSFCPALLGASDADIKPYFAPPPYDSVKYIPPFSATNPITGFPAIQIDPVTGLITGTPNRLGRYLVTVCCSEWRHGALINISRREFQFVVTNCSKVVVADIPQYSSDPNTYIVNCVDYTVHFVNTSKGGFSYSWNFGVPDITYDTSSAFQPTFVYPDTGTYPVKLIVNPSTTCPDSIIRLVKVYPRFRADFSDSGGQCPGAPIYFKDLSSATIKPVDFWKWSFGDGDSSFEQNPVHSYQYGGTYNVLLVSKNAKSCIDTSMEHVIIETFKPFAGDDTIIVKGEHILFNAAGGTKYAWSPPTYLSDTNIRDPLGFFPDTGRFMYTVFVESPYGCTGYDTIHVMVVNQAAFFVPSAFTPNGDGTNDFFHPVAIGYRSLEYLRVFNRWGEQVYLGKDLETGWDGTYKNQRAEVGVYFWELKFTDRFGKQGFMKGDVTLLR
jgi:gliding motility-associated-like protein